MRLLSDEMFSHRLFKDIDEPVICGSNIIFIQNSYNGSKIAVYNINSGKLKFISMKDTMCFNVHSDDESVAFEFSGVGKGIGIFHTDTLNIREIERNDSNLVLGGIWSDYLALRRGHDIVLFDTEKGSEQVLASCHHVFSTPVIGCGSCAWLQIYKDKCCVVLYDIEKKTSLIFALPGYINKIYLFEKYIAYQNCSNNKCTIYMYDINNSSLKKVYESYNWVELYRGKDGKIVWTVRKQHQSRYIFDVWVYSIQYEKTIKVLSNYESPVIPTISDDMVLWIGAGKEGDNLCLMSIDL